MMRRGTQSRNGNGNSNNGRRDQDEPEGVQSEKESRQPVYQLNYNTGSCSVIWISVWDASYEVDGKTKLAFSVTYKRSYFHDNKWKSAENVRADELHVLIHALNQAQAWCLEAMMQ